MKVSSVQFTMKDFKKRPVGIAFCGNVWLCFSWSSVCVDMIHLKVSIYSSKPDWSATKTARMLFLFILPLYCLMLCLFVVEDVTKWLIKLRHVHLKLYGLFWHR